MREYWNFAFGEEIALAELLLDAILVKPTMLRVVVCRCLAPRLNWSCFRIGCQFKVLWDV